jgi:transcriptional regulator with XRE-family HTH domain
MPQRKKAADPAALGKQLGRAIAERRRARGLTQEDLAQAVDIDSVTLSRLETGAAMPSVQRLFVIANALEASVGELLSEASPLAGDRATRLGAILRTLSERDQALLMDIAHAFNRRA